MNLPESRSPMRPGSDFRFAPVRSWRRLTAGAALALAAATALSGLADITIPPSGITAWIKATGCEVIR